MYCTIFKPLWFIPFGFHNVVDEFLLHTTDGKRKDHFIVTRNLFQDFLFLHIQKCHPWIKIHPNIFYFLNET